MKRALRKYLSPLLALSLLLGLAACKPKPSRYVQGMVTGVQTSPEGELLSFLARTDSGDQIGVLLTEETHLSPSGSMSGTPQEFRRAFQAELTVDTEVSAYCFTGRKSLTTPEGQTFPAYEAEDVSITGHLVRGGASLADGTALDVLEKSRYFTDRVYYLPNGVQLLSVSAPSGPANSYVMGQESLDDLSQAARERVLAYYEERGLLYDEAEELELAYNHQKIMGEAFRCHYLEQSVSPSASSQRVMYFLTTVSLPTDHGDQCTNYELRLGDAFDRETGAHLDPWDLFTCSREEVLSALLEANRIADPVLRSEMETALTPERVVLFPDSISLSFERGSLPSQEHDYILSTGIADLPGLLRDWAVPAAPDAQ